MIVPERWGVYVVDLAPRVGSKPGKQRPCVAIQPTEFSAAGLSSTVILPISTQLVDDAFPLRVRIPSGTAGIARESDILIDQILAWDNTLFRREIGTLPEALQADIRSAVREFLDL